MRFVLLFFLLYSMAPCFAEQCVKAEQLQFEPDNTESDSGQLQKRRYRLNLSFVLDACSGINNDERDVIYRALLRAVSLLRSQDTVSIISCDDSSSVVLPATKVSHSERIISGVRVSAGDGKMSLFKGLSKGVREIFKYYSSQSRHHLFVISSKRKRKGLETIENLGLLAQSFGEDNISISSFGVGRESDEEVLREIAVKSKGRFYAVPKIDELPLLLELDVKRLFDEAGIVLEQGVVAKKRGGS